jgi:hypothetical protein
VAFLCKQDTPTVESVNTIAQKITKAVDASLSSSQHSSMEEKKITDLQVCRAYLECEQISATPYDLLRSSTGLNHRACVEACYRAFAKGLIQYDRSLVRGWLTDEGYKLLGREPVGHELLQRLPPEHKPRQLKPMPAKIRFG